MVNLWPQRARWKFILKALFLINSEAVCGRARKSPAFQTRILGFFSLMKKITANPTGHKLLQLNNFYIQKPSIHKIRKKFRWILFQDTAAVITGLFSRQQTISAI